MWMFLQFFPLTSAHTASQEPTNLLRKFGPNRLLFATDYPDNRHLQPTEIYAAYFHILNQMDFTEEEAKKIAYWNAKELLG